MRWLNLLIPSGLFDQSAGARAKKIGEVCKPQYVRDRQAHKKAPKALERTEPCVSESRCSRVQPSPTSPSHADMQAGQCPSPRIHEPPKPPTFMFLLGQEPLTRTIPTRRAYTPCLPKWNHMDRCSGGRPLRVRGLARGPTPDTGLYYILSPAQILSFFCALGGSLGVPKPNPDSPRASTYSLQSGGRLLIMLEHEHTLSGRPLGCIYEEYTLTCFFV